MASYYVEWVVNDRDDGHVVQADSEQHAMELVTDWPEHLTPNFKITNVSRVGDCCG